jgi:quercetin dioxygenase-like cupin family protein
MSRPYTDIQIDDYCVQRKFDTNVDSQELYWHRDDEDRIVEVMKCGEGWKFQTDNELPINLEEGVTIFILRHEWHRVIKGSGDLLIKIYKYGKEETVR